MTPQQWPPAATASVVLVHREHRSWRLQHQHNHHAEDQIDHPNHHERNEQDHGEQDHEQQDRVGHLDQIYALTGASLIETGGTGAALAPDTLPPDLHAEIPAARRENRALAATLEQARYRWRHLALTLRREGLSTTQTAAALGISRAAVDKLLARATAETTTTPSIPSTQPGTSPTAERSATPDAATTRDNTPALASTPPHLQDVAARVQVVRRDVTQATDRQEKFSLRWRHLAVSLQDAGLTNRDIAHLMGIGEARVSQLAPRDGRRTVPDWPIPHGTGKQHQRTAPGNQHESAPPAAIVQQD